MNERDALIAQLVDHEGLRLKVYDDATGKELKRGDRLRGNLSIGIGRNLTGVGISRAEAVALCGDDIDVVVTDLFSFDWFATLDTIRQRAVCDFRFNVGAAGFRMFSAFIAAMAQRNYQGASLALLNSRWAKEVQPARVQLLRNQIETGTD